MIIFIPPFSGRKKREKNKQITRKPS